MLPPVRCFTCNKLLRASEFEARRHNGDACKQVLDDLNLTRMCCRRMLITHPFVLESSMLAYPAVNSKDESMFLDVRAKVDAERVVTCE